MKEYKLFVQRIGLIGISNILISLNTLILLPILTKNFVVGDYGIWVQVYATLILLPNIVNLGLQNTMARFLSGETKKSQIKNGFYSIMFIATFSSFIISLLFFIFSETIASTLFNNQTDIALIMAPTIFFTCLNSILISYFRTFQKITKYSLCLFIQTYLYVILTIYFTFSGFTIFYVILGFLITYVTIFIIMFSIIISEIGVEIPNFNNIKEYLYFGIPTIFGSASYWIVDSSDRYIIAFLLGTAFVGYYAPSYTIGNIILMFLAPFSLLLPSILPHYYDNKNIEKTKLYLNYSLKYFLLIAIPSVFGLSLLSKPLLLILTTNEIALNGYLVTPFVVVSALLYGIYGIISNTLILGKKTKIIGTIWIIAAILNFILNFLLIPYYGIIGAAAATLVAYIIPFSFTVYYSIHYFKLELKLDYIFNSVFASLIISLIIIFWEIKKNSLIDILILVIFCSIIYFAILLLLKTVKREEFEFMKSLLTNN